MGRNPKEFDKKMFESFCSLQCTVERCTISALSFNLQVTCMSFGFKYGIPADADLVFDVRCLPNPFYIPELKPHTGLDKDVYDYVMSYESSQTFFAKMKDLISYSLPLYAAEGKGSLVICFGCTGGKHRSVTLAEAMYAYLKEQDIPVNVFHRLNDAPFLPYRSTKY